jgi:hypothetical protein
MKARYVVLLFVLAGFAIAAGQTAVAAKGGAGLEGIPLPSGQFSLTTQGTEALCFIPGTETLEACSASGVLVVPITLLDNGAGSIDSAGNSCFQYTEVDTVLPVNAIPPLVQHLQSVAKVTSYDSTTGTGDSSITVYSGGQCNGATFDSTGATELASGTEHFAVTAGSSRIDSITTSATSPASAIASFSISETFLKETGPES